MWQVEAAPGIKEQRGAHPELLWNTALGCLNLTVTGYLLPVLWWVSLVTPVKGMEVGVT